MHEDSHDLTLVFEGEAGQGIQTISSALLPILKNSGYQVFSCTEYMSRIRGGSNTTELRITGKKRTAFSSSIDLLFAMSSLAFERLKGRIDDGTVIFADREQFGEHWGTNCVDMPLKRLATEAGGALYANTVIAAAALAMIGIPAERFNGYLQEQFSGKGESVVAANLHAAALGYEFARTLPSGFAFQLPVTMQEGAEERLLMDGNAALGIGMVLAGCNFISSYPMSPGTGLLTFLAAHAHDFGIVVDQAEDEIAAINAGLGASYAGARAVVTTSGGGFDLMQEGVSLAGMIETPIVVHIGQRPGPATGLPTRTEQGDLALVLHAGHGDFPRVVFAPGSTAEIVEIAQIAFNVAHTYQIPVFLLTDQYLLDAVCLIEKGEIPKLPIASSIVETTEGYRRYELTDTGISPRGVPGFGAGVVRVDSDEHDESGVITESFEMRQHMVQKRLRRLEQLRVDARPATPIGNVEKARTIVVCWGSNRGVVEEALEIFDSPDMAGLHFAQLFPLHPKSLELLENRRIIVIENNATGQFADLLTLETGRKVDRRIVKATGEPFSVEEVIEAFEEEENG